MTLTWCVFFYFYFFQRMFSVLVLWVDSLPCWNVILSLVKNPFNWWDQKIVQNVNVNLGICWGCSDGQCAASDHQKLQTFACFFFFSQSYSSSSLKRHQTKVASSSSAAAEAACLMQFCNSSLIMTSIQPSRVHECFSLAHCNLAFVMLRDGGGPKKQAGGKSSVNWTRCINQTLEKKLHQNHIYKCIWSKLILSVGPCDPNTYMSGN